MRVAKREVYIAADGREFEDKNECLAYETTLEPLIKTKMYAHGCKETNWEKGESFGLSGDALSEFSYSLYEVAFDVEIDRRTGVVMCTHLNGKALAEPIKV